MSALIEQVATDADFQTTQVTAVSTGSAVVGVIGGRNSANGTFSRIQAGRLTTQQIGKSGKFDFVIMANDGIKKNKAVAVKPAASIQFNINSQSLRFSNVAQGLYEPEPPIAYYTGDDDLISNKASLTQTISAMSDQDKINWVLGALQKVGIAQ